MHFTCIPNELQCEIFYHCLPTNRFARFSQVEAPLILPSVCKAWRELALSTSKLWSRFEVYFPGYRDVEDEERIFAGLRFWLRQSRTYPLSVKVTWEQSKQQSLAASEALSLLLVHDRRIRHMELSVPSASLDPLFDTHDFQALTSFAIDTRGVWNNSKALDVWALGINWCQVTNLHIDSDPKQSMNLDDCLDILTESANLSICILNVKAKFDCHLYGCSERISLPALSHLHLTLHDPDDLGEVSQSAIGLVSFLDRLDPSMLDSLQIEWLLHSWVGNEVWNGCHMKFMSFMECLKPSLSSLQLSYLPMAEFHLSQCLSVAPFLNTVDLHFNAGDEVNDPISDDLLKALTFKSFDTTLLPLVHSLNLQCSGGKCSSSAVAELVDSRIATKHIGFREFKIMTYRRLAGEMSSLLWKWESEGVKCTFDYITSN